MALVSANDGCEDGAILSVERCTTFRYPTKVFIAFALLISLAELNKSTAIGLRKTLLFPILLTLKRRIIEKEQILGSFQMEYIRSVSP